MQIGESIYIGVCIVERIANEPLTKQNLLKGVVYTFSNEMWCIAEKTDQLFKAEIYHETNNKHNWATGFKIWFNGTLFHSSKTFAPLKRKLNQLIKDYNLKLI